MDQLLDSMRTSRGLTSMAFYVLVLVIVFFIVFAIGLIYLFSRNITLESVRAKYADLATARILYVITGLVVFFILFMLVNSQYEVYFQKRPKVGIDRPLPPSTTFWKPGTTANPQDPYNLSVKSGEFIMSTPETYSLGIEIIVGDTRSNDKYGPYRHMFHRGSADLKAFINTSSPGSAPKGMGDLLDGLPTQMNPGVFLDQFSNDLMIFVDTDPVGLGEQSYRESIRVPDVPLKRGFYLHLTVHDRLVEVYINCRLAATKLLKGNPKGVLNDWYGRVGFSRAAAIVQNLTLWDSSLYAIETRNMCPPIVVAKNIAPTSCS
jgi:hypothetical protein